MNYPAEFALPYLHPLGAFAVPFLALILAWSIIIKGIALWKSARNGHKWWFIILLVLNDVGIAEIVYLIWFNKPTSTVAPAPAPAPSSSAPEA